MSVKPSVGQQLVPIEVIERRILLIRGHKVMLDSHLAGLYEVPTKRLNEAAKRNLKRFPPDFMSRLTKEEADAFKIAFCDAKLEVANCGLKSRRPALPSLHLYRAGRCHAVHGPQ
jgi:ORF6N domain